MRDETTINIPCPSGGAVEAKILVNDSGKRYMALARVYVDRSGEETETEVMPCSYEQCIAVVKAVVAATVTAYKANGIDRGLSPEKAEFEAVRQLPKALYAYLPEGFGAEPVSEVQALAPRDVGSQRNVGVRRNAFGLEL
jgi:hypothetical protein